MVESKSPLAIVTGAARGIGACIAQRLAVAGYTVALWDYDGEGAQARAAELTAAGHGQSPRAATSPMQPMSRPL